MSGKYSKSHWAPRLCRRWEASFFFPSFCGYHTHICTTDQGANLLAFACFRLDFTLTFRSPSPRCSCCATKSPRYRFPSNKIKTREQNHSFCRSPAGRCCCGCCYYYCCCGCPIGDAASAAATAVSAASARTTITVTSIAEELCPPIDIKNQVPTIHSSIQAGRVGRAVSRSVGRSVCRCAGVSVGRSVGRPPFRWIGRCCWLRRGVSGDDFSPLLPKRKCIDFAAADRTLLSFRLHR